MSGTRRRRLPHLTINRLVPNGLTLLSLCAGLTAVRLALNDHWMLATAAVGIAMVLDGLDGRIARLMGATSEFGAQLDSLADVINFGVTPALIIYLWALSDSAGAGWAPVLLFAMCMALRLARFNTQMGAPEPLPWSGRFFTGVPAPAAAGLALLPLVLSFELGDTVFRSPWLNIVNLGLVSGLMVSRIPTFSAKRLKLSQRHMGIALLVFGIFGAFLVSTPWVTLGVLGIVYLISIPIAFKTYHRLMAALPVEEGRDDDLGG